MSQPPSAKGDPAPTVSIVVPAYNVSAYIADALDSIRAQTYRDFETIVVNDGSPDTVELERVLEPYRSEIIYIVQENRGLAGARNAAIEVSKGPLIAFLDPDDFWDPKFLEVMVKTFQENPQLDVAYSNARAFSDSNVDGQTLMDYYPTTGQVTFETILSGQAWVFCCCVVRAETLKRVDGFDSNLRFAEDLDLWLRVSHAGGRFVPVRTPLVYYRKRSDSLTGAIELEKGIRLRIGVYEGVVKKLSLSPSELHAVHSAIRRYRAEIVGIRPILRKLRAFAKAVLNLLGIKVRRRTRSEVDGRAVRPEV